MLGRWGLLDRTYRYVEDPKEKKKNPIPQPIIDNPLFGIARS